MLCPQGSNLISRPLSSKRCHCLSIPYATQASYSELEITADHWTFSDQIVEMTDQISHATPQSLILCPSNVRPKHEPYF